MSRAVGNTVPVPADAACHLCGASRLHEFLEFRGFRRVTSDCRPWPAGGRLHICTTCRGVQKVADAVWRREADAIYADYAVYHQGQGAEQAVFEQTTGRPSPRSRRLLEAMLAQVRLPERGRALDVGCGNGATLRAFHEVLPAWTLAGTELNDRHREAIEAIDGAEPLYTCPPDQVPGAFDLITLVHVLEHIADPGGLLAALRAKLKPGGLLVAHLPHHVPNPFELLIADHCTHFTATTAAALLERAGYEIVAVADDWVTRELTVVAREPAAGPRRAPVSSDDAIAQELAFAQQQVTRSLGWLKSVAGLARELAADDGFGLFGTSIAANWLFAELEGKVAFFVDEDPNRAGRTYRDRRIYLPGEVPCASRVLIALPTELAGAVLRRIDRADVAFHLPPPE